MFYFVICCMLPCCRHHHHHQHCGMLCATTTPPPQLAMLTQQQCMHTLHLAALKQGRVLGQEITPVALSAGLPKQEDFSGIFCCCRGGCARV